MQESMHMLLYRAFHAQRNILRPTCGRWVWARGSPS